MWGTLEKISEQVTKYGSTLGQLWYIFVFIFRLIIVASLGASVYGDEQSEFKCGEDSFGCTNMCYNQFAKISHIRFWAFQLVVVITPTVFFHFYSIQVSRQILKLKNSEKNLKKAEEGDSDEVFLKEEKNISKRTKSVGEIKTRNVFLGDELKEVFYTRKIKFAYNVSVLFRLAIEGVFIYFGNVLFNKNSNQCYGKGTECNWSFIDIWWYDVPGTYYCRPDNSLDDVHLSCSRHFIKLPNKKMEGFVPCNVSRPFEKTVFLRYMIALSVICFSICALELLRAIFKKLSSTKWIKKENKTKFDKTTANSGNEALFHYPSVVPPSAPSKYASPFQTNFDFPLKVRAKNEAKEKPDIKKSYV